MVVTQYQINQNTLAFQQSQLALQNNTQELSLEDLVKSMEATNIQFQQETMTSIQNINQLVSDMEELKAQKMVSDMGELEVKKDFKEQTHQTKDETNENTTLEEAETTNENLARNK